ncbi:MAG: histidine kinase [Cyclobacteriaceae bacterium]
MMQFIKKRWVYHGLLWLLIFAGFAWLIYNNAEGEGAFVSILRAMFFFIPVVLVVYAVFALKSTLFPKRRYLLFTGMAIVVIGSVTALALLLEKMAPGTGARTSAWQLAMNLTSVSAIAIGLQYAKRGLVGQYQLQELKAKNAEIELSVLRTQLNPHFLFNTLNNICGINMTDPQKGTDMLMELADILRYHLSFSEMEKISLAEEIEFIRSYIMLEKLRLRDHSMVTTDFPEDPPPLHIAPLLILPYVENAFKHGTHATIPGFVSIAMHYSDHTLSVTIRNSVIPGQRKVSTRIGMQNTARRLALLYPGAHTLTVDETNDTYSVKLSLHI